MKFEPIDIDEIVNIHLSSFRGFFLSKMGKAFLTRYYLEVNSSPGSIFLISRRECILGFACGVSDASHFNKTFIRNNVFVVATSAIKAILLSPKTALRVFTRRKDIDHFPEEKNTLSLLSIGVLRSAARSGIGTELLKEFIEAAKIKGYRKIYLTTDRDNNESANAFYLKNGFAACGEYDSGNGRIMNEFQYNLED